MYQKMTHTLEDLKKLAAVELRDVNREELVDINDVEIKKDLSQRERIRKCLQSCRRFRMNDKIAIYLRLSLADGDLKKSSKDESNSIENQL